MKFTARIELRGINPYVMVSEARAQQIRPDWGQLSPSLQKEMLRYFARLKSDKARTRNIEQALNVLNGAKVRFMARAWN